MLFFQQRHFEIESMVKPYHQCNIGGWEAVGFCNGVKVTREGSAFIRDNLSSLYVCLASQIAAIAEAVTSVDVQASIR